jgi:hypothetical protein
MAGNVKDPIGRYEVRGQLGAGGFATVLLAYDPVLDGSVAIKVLADNLSLDAEVRGRFIQEARVLRGLRSERVVTVYDIGELPGGQPYLVMELARRGTLAARIDQARDRGRMPGPAEVIRVVDDLAAAVRVVHRDLKPTNLLLQADDDRHDDTDALMAADETLVLGDFGMAKVLGSDSLRLTMRGGTFGYVAPEQLRPFHPVDQRADLYAATAVVVELLTGRVPPGIESGEIDGLDDVLAPLEQSPGLVPALRRGLAIDPDHRYDTVDVWHDAIRSSLMFDASAPVHAFSFQGPPAPGDGVSAVGGFPLHPTVVAATTALVPVPAGAAPSPPGPVANPAASGAASPSWAATTAATPPAITGSPPPAGPFAPPSGPRPPGHRRRAVLAVVAILLALVGYTAVRALVPDGGGDVSITGPRQLTVGATGAYVADADIDDQVRWTGPGDATGSDQVFQLRPKSIGDLHISVEVRPPDGSPRRERITVEVVADDDDATGITGPAVLTVGETGTLVATVPPGTDPVWVDWNDEEHTGDRFSMRPTAPGVLTVELEAAGADGEVHRARHVITVVDR